MTKQTMAKKVKELKDLRALRDNLDHQIEELESVIKAEMIAQNTYEYCGEGWKVSWTLYENRRFSQSDFQMDHPKLYDKYKKTSTSRRFTIA